MGHSGVFRKPSGQLRNRGVLGVRTGGTPVLPGKGLSRRRYCTAACFRGLSETLNKDFVRAKDGGTFEKKGTTQRGGGGDERIEKKERTKTSQGTRSGEHCTWGLKRGKKSGPMTFGKEQGRGKKKQPQILLEENKSKKGEGKKNRVQF